MAFLASHKAAGHITGECISVDGGMEGRIVHRQSSPAQTSGTGNTSVPQSLAPPKRPRRLRIALSIDFDAISGYLGTGHTPENTLSDYSAGLLSANIGVPRLLNIFAKYGISDKVTWFIPGHSMETFPAETTKILESGCEIGLHGYSHEGAYAMTPEQENDVLEKCIELATRLKGGHRPVGYRAPLYQIRETTVHLLQEKGFLYDSSMNGHDSLPYLLPHPFPNKPPHVPDYKQKAETWMHPTPIPRAPETSSTGFEKTLVEIPTSWYTEDMTPLGFYPYTGSSHGYVSVDSVEKMWWDRFDWIWENESFTDENPFGSMFANIFHPESAGRAHIVGMTDRYIKELRKRVDASGGEITFDTFESVALAWKQIQGFE